MEKKNIGDFLGSFSKEELLGIKEVIEDNNKKTIIKQIKGLILEKEEKEKDFNHRLTIELMEQLHFFDSELLGILKSHNIKNIQDLIDSDLGTWGLTTQRKIELEEAKVWYDLCRIEEDSKENAKKKRK